ncbi:hypothetical protein GCM10010317_069380 [Streptomyces mirabilis]|nr:hypothetical protein GCM10010317_069380 [Streptomyces mirabilis]
MVEPEAFALPAVGPSAARALGLDMPLAFVVMALVHAERPDRKRE